MVPSASSDLSADAIERAAEAAKATGLAAPIAPAGTPAGQPAMLKSPGKIFDVAAQRSALIRTCTTHSDSFQKKMRTGIAALAKIMADGLVQEDDHELMMGFERLHAGLLFLTQKPCSVKVEGAEQGNGKEEELAPGDGFVDNYTTLSVWTPSDVLSADVPIADIAFNKKYSHLAEPLRRSLTPFASGVSRI